MFDGRASERWPLPRSRLPQEAQNATLAIGIQFIWEMSAKEALRRPAGAIRGHASVLALCNTSGGFEGVVP